MSDIKPTIAKPTKKFVVKPKPKPKLVLHSHLWVELVNAEESSEPTPYLWDIAVDPEAPNHLVRQIVKKMNAGETRFLHVKDDCPDSMAGLVDEEHEEADVRAEEVIAYLRMKCTEEFEYYPGMGGRPQVIITMGSC